MMHNFLRAVIVDYGEKLKHSLIVCYASVFYVILCFRISLSETENNELS